MMLMEALPLEAGVLLMDDPLLRYCMTPGSCVRRGTADVIISDQVTAGSRGLNGLDTKVHCLIVWNKRQSFIRNRKPHR